MTYSRFRYSVVTRRNTEFSLLQGRAERWRLIIRGDTPEGAVVIIVVGIAIEHVVLAQPAADIVFLGVRLAGEAVAPAQSAQGILTLRSICKGVSR